jgi:phosphate transport system permease protein
MLNPAQVNNIMRVVIWLLALAVSCLPFVMLFDLSSNGLQHLSLEFLFSNPADSGRSGGIASLLVATLWILVVCLIVVLPLGLSCALFLSEIVDEDSKLGRLLGHTLDILSGVPSIVYGLFGYAFFAEILGLGFSIASGGLSLACMVLPYFVRMAELTLRNSPQNYRQVAHALNLSHRGFIWRVLIPSAKNGIVASTIIAIGRSLAETAVLIFTAGYVSRMPDSWLDSGRTLSVHIFDLAMNVPGGTAPASATALVLIGMLIIINLGARKLSTQ